MIDLVFLGAVYSFGSSASRFLVPRYVRWILAWCSAVAGQITPAVLTCRSFWVFVGTFSLLGSVNRCAILVHRIIHYLDARAFAVSLGKHREFCCSSRPTSPSFPWGSVSSRGFPPEFSGQPVSNGKDVATYYFSVVGYWVCTFAGTLYYL